MRPRDGRTQGAAQDCRLHRDRPPRAESDSGALRAVDDADLPAAGSGPARFVLRAHGAGRQDRGTPLPRHHLTGPQPEGPHAQGVARAHGRGGTGLPRRRWTPEREESRRPLHDRARLLQQPPGVGRSAAHSRRRGAEHHQTVREPKANRRAARALPGSPDVLGGSRADLACLDQPGRRRPPAPGASLPRGAARGLRDRHQHDLGGSRYPAARTHGGAEPAEDARRVHSGDQPRRARRPAAGTGRDAVERAQTTGPLALRAVPSLPRDLLPLGGGWRA